MNTIFKLIVASFVLNTAHLSAQDTEAGKSIFQSRCASCHAIDKKMIGPALKGVEERHSEKWIIDFVRHSQSIIKSGDTEAVAIFKEYNSTIMPDHLDLKEKDVQNILAFIKSESGRLANASSGPRVPDRYKPYMDRKKGTWHQILYLDVPGNHIPVTFGDKTFWFAIFILIIVIVSLLIIIVKTKDLYDNSDE